MLPDYFSFDTLLSVLAELRQSVRGFPREVHRGVLVAHVLPQVCVCLCVCVCVCACVRVFECVYGLALVHAFFFLKKAAPGPSF